MMILVLRPVETVMPIFSAIASKVFISERMRFLQRNATRRRGAFVGWWGILRNELICWTLTVETKLFEW